MHLSSSPLTLCVWALGALALAGSAYQLLAAFAIRRLSRLRVPAPVRRPPVSILKPLCGNEPQLYINLRSFCAINYPDLQIVFGVRDPDDPAIAVVRRLQVEFPEVDIVLVNDPRIYGTNYKISNLINMMYAATHDILVLSDSDMHVDGAYLDAVLGTLERPGVGLSTCLYVGTPTAGSWSALGAAGVNFWFLPSAAVSKLLGGKRGCYGASIALRRDTLERVGGFIALKDQLADDYALGGLVREAGLQVAVAPYFPRTTVDEPSFDALFQHELRWARTIRNTAPIGYAGSASTHPVPLALLTALFGSVAEVPWPMLIISMALAIAGRAVLVAEVMQAVSAPKPRWWILLVRDLLSLAILIVAYCGRSVSWRESVFRVDSAGALSTEMDGI
jgi:ceramide glucosyltransferase